MTVPLVGNPRSSMRGKKILLIIVGLTLLLAVLGLMLRRRTAQSAIASVASAQDGAFLVQVERPAFSGRPIWEVPRAIFGDGGDGDLRFGDMTPGAKVEHVDPTRLELSADGGWELVIVSDDQGQVLPGTHLMFSLSLPGRTLKLDCYPANPAVGHFNSKLRTGSDRIDGDFLLKLPACKNAVSRKNTAGLPTFTVRGGFKGLPRIAKMVDG